MWSLPVLQVLSANFRCYFTGARLAWHKGDICLVRDLRPACPLPPLACEVWLRQEDAHTIHAIPWDIPSIIKNLLCIKVCQGPEGRWNISCLHMVRRHPLTYSWLYILHSLLCSLSLSLLGVVPLLAVITSSIARWMASTCGIFKQLPRDVLCTCLHLGQWETFCAKRTWRAWFRMSERGGGEFEGRGRLDRNSHNRAHIWRGGNGKGGIRICLPVHRLFARSDRQPYGHTDATSSPCWRTTKLCARQSFSSTLSAPRVAATSYCDPGRHANVIIPPVCLSSVEPTPPQLPKLEIRAACYRIETRGKPENSWGGSEEQHPRQHSLQHPEFSLQSSQHPPQLFSGFPRVSIL